MRVTSIFTLSHITHLMVCGLEKINSILKKSEEKKVPLKNYIEIISVLIFLPILPIYNIILILLNYSIMILNINNIIIFSVLVILSFFDMIYLLRIGFKEIRKNYLRKIEFEIPYYNYLETEDLSEEIIHYSQSLYFIVFIIFRFSLEAIFKNLMLIMLLFFVEFFLHLLA